MTRDEARYKIIEMYMRTTEYYGNDFEGLIDGIYDYFEQRIAELEAPKMCKTCKYSVNCFILDSLNARMDMDGFSCNRYKPKDK